MTTSGSANFSMSRDEIIIDVLEDLGVLAAGETARSEDVTTVARKLNMMVKSLMKPGVHLWGLSEATLFLSVGTATYSLGATGAHCTNSYVQTTLSTAEALGSTSLGITSASGMSASDNIGIVLDDGTIHWTTISGAPGSTTTIATGLASAAAAGNVVFAYTNKINRPLRILSAYRRSISGTDTPITLCAREEYANLSNKSARGKTVKAFYNPQLVNGILSAWPTPDLVTDVIRIWHERPLEDFDSATDTPDFPIEWAEAISAGTAMRCADAFPQSPTQLSRLERKAVASLAAAMEFDKEIVPVFFQPDMR